ncbi:23S rRNA (uracil(1939)-C(5))-methyltransferase RlmD [bacterium]|nr:MAG: 23S rRNA (uracil(1939)-C(5))-methyltransferase RlmD [bacterium]
MKKNPPQSPCPHPECPGCPLITADYAAQLEEKRRIVTVAFEKCFGPGNFPEVEEVVPSPSLLGYRSSSKLALQKSARGPAVGIYREGTHGVVDIPGCPVHSPLVALGVRKLRSLLRLIPSLLPTRRSPAGWLRYAVFTASEEEQKLLVTLVTATGEDEGLLRSLAARLQEEIPNLAGVLVNVNPSEGNEIFGSEWKVLRGEGFIRERFGEVILRASGGSFLQANRAQAGAAYRKAVELLNPVAEDIVYDLYCGVGGLALNLGRSVGKVVGIEVNPLAIADATATAEETGVKNVSFVQGAVEEALPELLREGPPPSIVTLNPARKGADEKVLSVIVEAAPRAVLYLSCNPETLSRDVHILKGSGHYEIALIKPFDFLPQTAHVETLALLSRK